MRVLPIILLVVICLSARAADEVQSQDLPTTVKEAMDRVAKGADLSGIEKTMGANGKVVYTAKYISSKSGKEASVSVSEDGKVVRNGSDGDHNSKSKTKTTVK